MDARTASSEIAAGCYAARSRGLARSITRVYEDHLRPFALTSSQQTVLTVIAQGASRPVEVGQMLDMEKSTVTRALQLMESKGWVTVVADGRGRSVALTAAGEDLLVSSLEPWRAATSEIAERIRVDQGLVPNLAPRRADS